MPTHELSTAYFWTLGLLTHDDNKMTLIFEKAIWQNKGI